ncbi:DNA methyltransferase [Fontibacter flavus]|uniref:DNA methyltransferase n=1 Tax=Fontibacter flavus TaxID=654838 RepID=A0ABV6FVC1_9BACT
MYKPKKKDTHEVSIPTIKVEEVSEKNLSELKNSQFSCTKMIDDYGYRSAPVIQQKFPENLDPTKLRPVKFRPVYDVSIDKVKIHHSAGLTYIKKNLNSLKFTIEKFGQIDPIAVVKKGDFYFVFDGISRLKVAQELGWEKIRIEVFNYSDDELGDIHIIKNVKTKRSIQEQIQKAKFILGILGKSQGKKRKSVVGLDLTENDYGFAGKDRYQIACAILGLDFCSSTLRKLIEISDFEENGNEEVKGLGLIDKIENKGMSISNAFNLMKIYKESVKERQEETSIMKSLDAGYNNRYLLFNKSCEDLSDLEKKIIQLIIFSPPYFNMRIYPEGVSPADIPFGLESNPDEYVKRSIEFYRGFKRVLKDDGSLFINVAESYKNGVSSLTVSKLIIAMVEDGWHLVQTIKWKKTNAKPQGNIKRLRPVTEEILHFVKNPKNFKFKELVFWSEDENITVQTGCNDEISGDKKSKKPKFSLKRPRVSLTDFLESQKVQGIIEGSIFNWSKLKKIDPNYIHVAPSPDYLAIIPILMTTDPGDIVMDAFSGSGTFLDTAIRLGRNGVGYDTDPKSIEFSKKRLNHALEEEIPGEELHRIENQYFKNAA